MAMAIGETSCRQPDVVSQWAYATMQCWKIFTNHLVKHNRRIKFEDFDESGLNKYLKFLRVTDYRSPQETRFSIVSLPYNNTATQKSGC